MIEVLTINYNTPELTELAVRSVQKFTPDCSVTVFDNSDRRPMKPMPGVRLIDNTKGSLIDFQALLDSYTDKIFQTNRWGSAKHAKTVDFCMDIFPNGFVLMDSDVIMKRDITALMDKSCVWVGEVQNMIHRQQYAVLRVLPILCSINVPMIRKHGIRYFDGLRCWKLTTAIPQRWYDTGASFYEDTVFLPHREIRLRDYCEHLHNGSWSDKDIFPWLEKGKHLLSS